MLFCISVEIVHHHLSFAKSCLTLYGPMGCSTPGSPAVHQGPLSFAISWSFLKLMSIESVTISSSATPFCLKSFQASESFPVSQLFASGGQSIGASASASALSVNIQGWFPLGLTDLISLQSKGLSNVFSSTIIQKHQFFSSQPSLWSNSHICT